MTLEEFTAGMANTINTVMLSPGRTIRTAEEMSRFAPFVDDATSIDRTAFANTYISYYTWGEAIGLGLDLSLRARSNGKITLDHYMRALWEKHGKPGGRRPGYMDNPYTIADLKAALATVSGDAAFANDFFARYIQGHEVVDYVSLLDRAGLVLRPQSPSEGFAGQLVLRDGSGRARIEAPVPFGSPAYAAGLERDDAIVSIGGVEVTSAGDAGRLIRGAKPGSTVPIVFERRGQRVESTLRVIADPRVELIPGERVGRAPSAEQQRFRSAWLSSASGNTF
jgi:predicted metalloprotease with PDZ domain